MPDQSRQLAAIMFTDIVGYTALMGKDSTKALELVRISKEIQKPLVKRHNGKWLKEMGDGVLVQFNSALDAVDCAIEIQESARTKFDGKLRIGIHSGDITIENNDVYGDGVNIASRLESICDPGGIYISESIEKAIRGQSNVQTIYLGEIKLKNVDYDVRTYALQGVGLPFPNMKENKNLSGKFILELQRRGIVRAGITYMVLSLLLILLLPYTKLLIDLPTWSSTVLYTMLIIGFPISIYFAWNYERSPDGFVKTTSLQSWQNPYKSSQRKPLTSTNIIAVMGLIIVIMYFQSRYLNKTENKVGDRSETEILDKSIAVIPFRNDSSDPENEYFCNGMMEEILNQLQKISDLKVKSRTAIEPYRNTSKTFETIAKELNVNFIVEGSVRKSGNDLRITLQLIDVKTGDHLWSETYDGKYTEKIFDFQSNVANRVAASMGAVIKQDEEHRIRTLSVDDLKAYDYYIRGKHEINKYEGSRDERRLKEAKLLLDKSLEINSRYVKALNLKGHVFFREGNYDSVLVYADRILEIEPESGLAYQLKGDYYFYSAFDIDLTIEYYQKSLKHFKIEEMEDRKWSEIMLGELFCLLKNDYRKGLSYYQKGLDMESEYLEAGYLMLGLDFGYIGAYEKAEKYLQKSLDQKVSCLGIAHFAEALMLQSKFSEALHFLDSMCEQSCIANCNKMKFYIYFGQKNSDLAEDYAQFVNVSGPPYVGDSTFLAYVYYQQGKDKLAETVLNRIKNSLQHKRAEDIIMYFTNNLRLSYLHAILNENQEALKYLSQAVDDGTMHAFDYFVELNPIFAELRNDPEFQAVVKRIQDKKAAIRAQIREMEERGELNL